MIVPVTDFVSGFPVIYEGNIKLLFTGSPHRLSEANLSVLPLLTDEDSPEANMDTHQCKRVFLLEYLRNTQNVLVIIAEVFLSLRTCSPSVQVPSLTGLTADCFPSHFTLKSAAQCAKSINPPTLTLQLNQLSLGKDSVCTLTAFYNHL